MDTALAEVIRTAMLAGCLFLPQVPQADTFDDPPPVAAQPDWDAMAAARIELLKQLAMADDPFSQQPTFAQAPTIRIWQSGSHVIRNYECTASGPKRSSIIAVPAYMIPAQATAIPQTPR
jgi:hypothetical protein